MKGLLLKDFYGLRSFGKTSLLVIAIYAGISIFSGGASYFSSMAIVFCAMLPLTSVSIDEQAKWNAYAQCMPITRRQTVGSKYLMVLLIVLACAVFSLAISMFATQWEETFYTVLLSLSIAIIINALILPLVFRFGVEKARLLVMVVFLVCFMGIMLFLSSDMDNLDIAFETTSLILPAVAAALFAGSFFVSARIVEAKEL